MEEMKIKKGTFLVAVSTAIRGVKSQRTKEPDEKQGDTVIKRGRSVTVIASKTWHDRAAALKRKAHGIVENVPKTILGRLTDADTVATLRAEFSALRDMVTAFNADPSNPHRVYVDLATMPVSPDLDAETLRGIWREIEEKLIDLRAIVVAHDEPALKNWRRNNAHLVSFLPDISARSVTEGIKAAVATRDAIKKRVKAGETIESAVRAEESGLALLDASIGFVVGAIESTVDDGAAAVSALAS